MNENTYDDDDDNIMLDKVDLDGYVDDYQQLSIYRQRLIKAQIQDIEVNNYYNINANIDDNERDRNRDGDGKEDKNDDANEDTDEDDNIVLNNGISLDTILLNENNGTNLLLKKIEQVEY